MSFIEAAPKKEPVEAIATKIRESVAQKLRAYTEFLNGPSIGWTIEGVMERAWEKDKDFAEWLAKHPMSGERAKKQAAEQVRTLAKAG